MDRQLSIEEMQLLRWMLEHGNPEAKDFLTQLEKARVTPWRCTCGCASFNLSIAGHPKPSGGIHPIADFVCGSGDNLSGIFAYEQEGILAGLEIYGLAGDAPKVLPSPADLRSFSDEARSLL